MEIAIFSPSGPPEQTTLKQATTQLSQHFSTTSVDAQISDKWPLTNGTPQERANILNSLMFSDKYDILWASRGGYGAQELLSLVEWDNDIQKRTLLIGFSDITALQMALWTKKKIPSIHGPMPGTSYWHYESESVQKTLLILTQQKIDDLPIFPINHKQVSSEEQLLIGGCFSVLTNLIGTPYFQPPKGIIFWEDVGEHPGRVLRSLYQWTQSGYLAEVKAIILGRFSNSPIEQEISEQQLFSEIASRVKIPVYHCPHIGHQESNHPIGIGVPAKIHQNKLTWRLR